MHSQLLDVRIAQVVHVSVVAWLDHRPGEVSRGSAEPPRLVQVSYRPRGGRGDPLVLVGKAITFDSGGLSLKPTESMVTMNTDMAGSAAVLGALSVVAALRPELPVHAVLGACENMPGGKAYKPSDVL